MSDGVTVAHRIQFGLFRAMEGFLAVLPRSWALGLGSFLGAVAGGLFRIRRQVTGENLARAFPDRDPAWRRRVGLASYRHLARESVATFLLGRATREDVLALTRVEGLEEFRQDLARGQGIVLFSGHLGNWEIGGAALTARGIPVDGVAQVQRNPLFDRELRRTREALGLRIVPKQEAPRRALRALRDGRVVALVADQNVTRGGIFVDFFDTPAATAKGPAVFALRTGAPLWLGCGLSRGPGRGYRVILQRIEADPTGDMERDVEKLVRAQASLLEEAIRAHPEQYFWQHKRWKTRPSIPEPTPKGDDITR